MKPGDIFFVDYPTADGREQSGMRPSLILQDDGYAGQSPLVLAIPFTTASKTAVRFPAVIPVAPTVSNGLTAPSFLLVFQIRATDRRRIRRKIGQLDPSQLARIYEALDRLTGRPFLPLTGTPQPGAN